MTEEFHQHIIDFSGFFSIGVFAEDVHTVANIHAQGQGASGQVLLEGGQ